MPRIHFKCENGLNLRVIGHPRYESGDWDISTQEAEALIGGTLHLHQTKRTPSYFGGVIESYRVVETDNAHSTRIAFVVRSTLDARGVRWSGNDHVRAWTSGVIYD